MHITRRRFITITAAAGGLPLLPFAPAARTTPLLRVWSGVALGADATMQIHRLRCDGAAALGSLRWALLPSRRFP